MSIEHEGGTPSDMPSETTALLGSRRSARSRSSSRRRQPTPLPKLQLGIVMLFQLAEPMTSHCIYPFINQLVAELPITHGDPSKVGYYAGLIQSLFFAAEACTVLVWARLSDRIGRKPVLLIGLSGLSVSMILFGLARTFWTLVITRALAGMLNGNIGVIKSMVGELTDSTNMSQAFGIMPVVWATGVTIAPLMGGTLSHPYETFPRLFNGDFWHQYPYFLPCFASACFSAFSFIIALVFLKETVRKRAKHHEQSTVEAQTQAAANQCNTIGGDQPGGLPAEVPSAHKRQTSHTSGRTLVEPEEDAVIPFRQLLTRPIILSIANYGALAVLDIAFGALQPLFFSTPIRHGGLGFSPARIGLVLGLFGMLNGVFQGLCFARIVGRAGVRRTFMFSMGCFMVVFALFPVINNLARASGVGAKVWVTIVLQLCFWCLMDMSYGCVFMYITSASPSKRSLGSVNGMAQLTASIVRTLGPAASTSLFAASHRYNLLGGCLVYVVFVVLSALAVFLASKLPSDAWEMDEEDGST